MNGLMCFLIAFMVVCGVGMGINTLDTVRQAVCHTDSECAAYCGVDDVECDGGPQP